MTTIASAAPRQEYDLARSTAWSPSKSISPASPSPTPSWPVLEPSVSNPQRRRV